VDARTCTGYYNTMGMTGAIDEKIYLPETKIIGQLLMLEEEIDDLFMIQKTEEHCLYLDVCNSCLTEETFKTIKGSELYMASVRK
jgi:hypothetical protein